MSANITRLLKGALTAGDLKRRVDPEPEVRLLRDQNRVLKSRVDELKFALGETQEFFNALKGAIEVAKPPSLTYRPKEAVGTAKVSRPCSAVWHLTDWHIGEVVEPNEVEEFNEFNLAVAHRRMQRYVQATMEWLDLHRHSYRIGEMVIICTGDFISGDIHDELRVSNEFPAPMQCVEAGMLLSSSILGIVQHFEKVRVEFVVPDNHSRLTKKAQYKQGGANSLNYIVGWIAKERLAACPTVEFKIHTGHNAVVEVQGFRYLCQHGHGIKGTWGIPYYGVERVTSQAAKARMNMPEARRFHKLVIGHFHAPLNSTYWMIGGSLSGTNELDHANNRYSKPSQTSWLMHPTHGEVDYNPFVLP